MNFGDFKNKVISFKDKVVETWAKKIAESSLVLRTKPELEEFIKLSQNKDFVNPETGEQKVFARRAIVIFVEKDSKFYEEFLLQIPILFTKSWSQNVVFKLCDLNISDLTDYSINSLPSFVVFENEKLIKVLEWEENIKKVVKALSLDINNTIDNI